MKKLITIILLLLFVLPVGAAQTATITAQNTYITPVSVPNHGYLSLSITGTWSATVTLERRINVGGSWQAWGTVESFTANVEKIIANPTNKQIQYRAGVATGDYTSGSVVIVLSE